MLRAPKFLAHAARGRVGVAAPAVSRRAFASYVGIAFKGKYACELFVTIGSLFQL